MVTLIMTVMSRAQLQPKPRHNKHNKEPQQVPGPKVFQLRRTAQPAPSEGAMSGLANMKRKLAEIDKEREKIINIQQKIKDDVSEMTDSFSKMSGDMVNLRKDLSDLSESVGRQMKELKEIMSSLINSRLNPTRGSPKRKKGSQAELNMVHHQMRPTHAPQFMRRNHGIACVNLMERTIASSA
jgi:DNA repair ATPase RecN